MWNMKSGILAFEGLFLPRNCAQRLPSAPPCPAGMVLVVFVSLTSCFSVTNPEQLIGHNICRRVGLRPLECVSYHREWEMHRVRNFPDPGSCPDWLSRGPLWLACSLRLPEFYYGFHRVSDPLDSFVHIKGWRNNHLYCSRFREPPTTNPNKTLPQ